MNDSTLTDADFEPAALDMLSSGPQVVFLTGKAGTGKSTLVNHWLAHHAPANTLTLAPTGIAALNLVGGETIHRFMHARPGVTVEQAKADGARRRRDPLYSTLDALVVDEVSMVRADLMDCLDAFLSAARGSKRPFGGLRMVLVGDLMQLPPVVARGEAAAFSGDPWPSPWFFDSAAIRHAIASGLFASCSLERVHRQSDPVFVDALNHIRMGDASPSILSVIDARAGSHYDPGSMDDAVTLAATNARADQVNALRLGSLPYSGSIWKASIQGEWSKSLRPAPETLDVRVGERVMMVANEPSGLYANGSMGTVDGFESSLPVVRLDDGPVVAIGPHDWQVTAARAVTDPDTGERRLETYVVGSYRQLPLKPGWAVTVHKSQGQTFDRVHLELPPTPLFADGQAYVALSRVRSLAGLTMNRPLWARDVRANRKALAFLSAPHEPSGQSALF